MIQAPSKLGGFPLSSTVLQFGDRVIRAAASCAHLRSHHINAVSAASRCPLAAVGEAAVIGGRAVHVWRLQLHLAGGDGCIEFYLGPVHDVEHQADADDDLQETEEGVMTWWFDTPTYTTVHYNNHKLLSQKWP